MGLPRQEYWIGLPCPPPGDLPHPGIKPCLVRWQADSLPLSHQGSPILNAQRQKQQCWGGSDPAANIYPTRHFTVAHFSISGLWWPLRGLSGDTLSRPVIGDSAQTAPVHKSFLATLHHTRPKAGALHLGLSARNTPHTSPLCLCLSFWFITEQVRTGSRFPICQQGPALSASTTIGMQ